MTSYVNHIIQWFFDNFQWKYSITSMSPSKANFGISYLFYAYLDSILCWTLPALHLISVIEWLELPLFCIKLQCFSCDEFSLFLESSSCRTLCWEEWKWASNFLCRWNTTQKHIWECGWHYLAPQFLSAVHSDRSSYSAVLTTN
jgi:hypothetical protein